MIGEGLSMKETPIIMTAETDAEVKQLFRASGFTGKEIVVEPEVD
jgi:hypothetical protein